MCIKSSCQWAVFPLTVSVLLASEASEAWSSWQICGKMRYRVSSLAASPVQPRGVRALEPEEPVRGRESALSIAASLRRRAAGVVAGPFYARFTCPTCHFSLPTELRGERERERGKVWLQQLVALATLCGTAADWNRNWPIHVSLQAGSGPCLVLRLSDFHSDGSGISPTPPLWKSDPGQPLSESPQSPPLFSHFLS